MLVCVGKSAMPYCNNTQVALRSAGAVLQGPLCRFGDTAANAGMLSVLAEYEATRNLPLGVQTAAASGAAACWRMVLLPLDAVKTMMQVSNALHVWCYAGV